MEVLHNAIASDADINIILYSFNMVRLSNKSSQSK